MTHKSSYSDYFFVSDRYIPEYDVPKQSLRNIFNLKEINYTKYKEFQSETNDLIDVTKHVIPAIIIEVNNDYVILNCLIDEEKKKFQRRKFDLDPLKGKFDLVVGEGLYIIIETKSGERKTTYIKDDSIKFLFEEPKDRFSRFKGTSVFPDYEK